MIPMLLMTFGTAFASAPTDLGGLVDLALERDPEATALGYDADSARASASAGSRLMDPQVMIGVESLGSMAKVEPPMAMVGATQMFRGWGESRARSNRLDLDVTRAEVDRERVAADLRARLWKAAARIEAMQAELALIQEQIRSASALREIGFARYAAGADVGGMNAMSGAASPSMGGMGGDMAMGTEPPAVVPRGGGGGMGMGGMGGPAKAGSGPTVPQSTLPPAAPARMPAGGSGGMATLLRLDAEIARVEADRVSLQHQLDGEVAVLAVFVGDAAAEAVSSAPSAYFGSGGGAVPETRLAGIDREAADADLKIARAARRPDLMVSVSEKFMAGGMLGGTDVSVGVEVPLWGGRGRDIDAARARIGAADARAERVERDLTAAVAQARAGLEAAKARSASLDSSALPRSRAAWDATLALFAAGQGREDDVVRAWETWIAIGREAVAARRDVQLRAAELARVEGT